VLEPGKWWLGSIFYTRLARFSHIMTYEWNTILSTLKQEDQIHQARVVSHFAGDQMRSKIVFAAKLAVRFC
jgi:hypothetical protein